MKSARAIFVPFLLLCLAQTGDALACKVPVFRYALERWPADSYRIVAVVDGDVQGDVADAIERLRGDAANRLNAETEVVNLAELTEAQLWQVEGLEDTSEVPQLQVFYPERDGRRKLCWKGELNSENLDRWLDSPLRNSIADDIQSGASAVWVLVEGKDAAENDRLAQDLERALEAVSGELEISEGVIARRDAARYLKEHPSASMDDVLRCDLPLEIRFTVQRLEHGSERESAMMAMIRNWMGSEPIEAPFVFPVFGRGRMIEPLSMASFSSESVASACRYLVGECSCSVKALNPGVDLLLATDWSETLGDEIVLVETGAAIAQAGQLLTIPPGSETGSNGEPEPSERAELAPLGAEASSGASSDADSSSRWAWLGVGTFIALSSLGVWSVARRGRAQDDAE